VREAARTHKTRVVTTIELRQHRKLFVGATREDSKISLKIGDRLKIITDESHVGSQDNMTVAVRNCTAFKKCSIGSMVFFDMGSICAQVKKVSKNLIEVEA